MTINASFTFQFQRYINFQSTVRYPWKLAVRLQTISLTSIETWFFMLTFTPRAIDSQAKGNFSIYRNSRNISCSWFVRRFSTRPFFPPRPFESHVIVYLQPPGQKQYRWDSFSCTKRPVTWLHKENYKVTRTRPNNDLLSTIIIHFRHFHKINHREFTVLLLLTIIVQLDGCVKGYLRGWFSRNW